MKSSQELQGLFAMYLYTLCINKHVCIAYVCISDLHLHVFIPFNCRKPRKTRDEVAKSLLL